jgi:hypothetical protein
MGKRNQEYKASSKPREKGEEEMKPKEVLENRKNLCPKCSTLLVAKPSEGGYKPQVKMVCMKCGWHTDWK